jgi:ligand-binding sensor domain-containing protein
VETLAGTDIGVYRSTDDGNIWTRVSGSSRTILGIRALCTETDGSIFAGVRSPDLLLRYTSREPIWTPAAAGLETIGVLSIAIGPSGTLFCGTNGTGVYSSGDRGATWDPMNNGMGSAVVQVLLFNGNGDLFAGTSHDGVFRLRRGTAVWSRITELPTGLLVRGMSSGALGQMMLSAGESVYRSSDNGDHWELCPGKPGTPQILALLQIPPSTAYAGTNNGVYQSTDNGNTWTPYYVGMDRQPVYALTRNSGGRLIAGTANGIYRARR